MDRRLRGAWRWTTGTEARYQRLRRSRLRGAIDAHPPCEWRHIASACPWGCGLAGLHRALHPATSISLHCDYRAHRLPRILMDRVLGPQQFRNETVRCYTGPSNTTRWFPRKPTGATALDSDGLGDDAPAVQAMGAAVRTGPYTLAVFISPSGVHLKVLAHVSRLPCTDAEHEAAFEAVYRTTGMRWGSSRPTRTRREPPTPLVFLSHGAGAVLRLPKGTYAIHWK